LESSEEFRESDFVLFKIDKTTKRNDVKKLAFQQEYNEIYNYLANQTEITDKERKYIRTKMFHLMVSIQQSPDLTPAHAQLIMKEMSNEVNMFIETLSNLGDKQKMGGQSEIENLMDNAMNLLNF
jgi:hypothetical protein